MWSTSIVHKFQLDRTLNVREGFETLIKVNLFSKNVGQEKEGRSIYQRKRVD